MTANMAQGGSYKRVQGLANLPINHPDVEMCDGLELDAALLTGKGKCSLAIRIFRQCWIDKIVGVGADQHYLVTGSAQAGEEPAV